MSKVTVITGGTSGIGRGIVEKILANSAEDDLIFATYAHNAYKANEFWDSLKPEDQEKLIILKADMSSYDDMMNFVGEVKEKAGHVDWLISNAGISTYDKFQDYTFEEWNKIVNTNLSVPVFMVKEFMPVMTEGGRVLFMGSYAGQQAYSSSLVYGVTKAAIHFLTKSLVKEFEPKGITVNAIAPGFFCLYTYRYPGMRTAHRKATNASTARSHCTDSVRSKTWQIWRTVYLPITT